jgi:NADPH2:quinone reductase
MRAIVLHAPGGPEAFALAELPDPQPRPGELLLRVAGSSVNPIDLRLRSGLLPALLMPAPAILGIDGAGTVAAIGAGVRGFKVGDGVYGCVGGAGRQPGALAELVAVDHRLLARAPRKVPLAEAAVLPVAALTAWEMCARAGRLTGQTVLVTGAAGGVGHLVVQLARSRGARVVGIANGSERCDFVRRLGAEYCMDRSEPDLPARLAAIGSGSFGTVLDCVGGAEGLAFAFGQATVGGCVVTIQARATVDLAALHGKALSLHAIFVLLPLLSGDGEARARHGAILQEMAGLVDQGVLRPQIAERFPMDQVGAAHARLAAGGVAGKLALVTPW